MLTKLLCDQVSIQIKASIFYQRNRESGNKQKKSNVIQRLFINN